MDNDTFYNDLSRPSPVPEGTRVEMIYQPNDPDPIEPGARGTVTGGNGAQVYVDWDNGRSLILLPGVDRWKVVRE